MRVGFTDDVVLDGSQSSDPNIDALLDQGLTYSWRCVLDDGVIAQACVDKDGNSLMLASEKSVTIPGGTLDPSPTESVPYKFVLRVTKRGRCVFML